MQDIRAEESRREGWMRVSLDLRNQERLHREGCYRITKMTPESDDKKTLGHKTMDRQKALGRLVERQKGGISVVSSQV